jgi:hypothetical protein
MVHQHGVHYPHELTGRGEKILGSHELCRQGSIGLNHCMAEVKVYIVGKDRKVGAMVKALAREISGFTPIRGATKDFLSEHGFYLFDFPSASGAAEFKEAFRKYLPVALATIQE